MHVGPDAIPFVPSRVDTPFHPEATWPRCQRWTWVGQIFSLHFKQQCLRRGRLCSINHASRELRGGDDSRTSGSLPTSALCVWTGLISGRTITLAPPSLFSFGWPFLRPQLTPSERKAKIRRVKLLVLPQAQSALAKGPLHLPAIPLLFPVLVWLRGPSPSSLSPTSTPIPSGKARGSSFLTCPRYGVRYGMGRGTTLKATLAEGRQELGMTWRIWHGLRTCGRKRRIRSPSNELRNEAASRGLIFKVSFESASKTVKA